MDFDNFRTLTNDSKDDSGIQTQSSMDVLGSFEKSGRNKKRILEQNNEEYQPFQLKFQRTNETRMTIYFSSH